jgi:KTSC domain
MNATVTMVPVESSNIKAVGHDAATNELHIRFTNGTTYIHSGVPRAFYQNMLQAPSKGKYHAERIKGTFPHRKL